MVLSSEIICQLSLQIDTLTLWGHDGTLRHGTEVLGHDSDVFFCSEDLPADFAAVLANFIHQMEKTPQPPPEEIPEHLKKKLHSRSSHDHGHAHNHGHHHHGHHDHAGAEQFGHNFGL